MTFLELENVSLTFHLRQQRQMLLKDRLLQLLSRKTSNSMKHVHALQNVNLRVGEGERVGIVGHNGAGKSTLLKLLAGIYPPSTGTRTVSGEISSLFDLQLGFEPDATGIENILFRGYLQGETPKSIRAKLQSIADFSELGDFLNSAIRYYSSGMVVRLAFAIATAIDPEILLLDEVLSAGDAGFQRKARKRMREMIDHARLIVMVSHDIDALADFCNRIIWMDHGRVVLDGKTDEVLDAYLSEMRGDQPADPAHREAA